MWGASLISSLLGTRLPGAGAIYLEQTLRFRRPIAIGDPINVSVAVASKDATRHRIVLDCRCVNQRGETVIEGTAKVLAPTEKVRRPRFTLPEVSLREHGADSRRARRGSRSSPQWRCGRRRMMLLAPVSETARQSHPPVPSSVGSR